MLTTAVAMFCLNLVQQLREVLLLASRYFDCIHSAHWLIKLQTNLVNMFPHYQ